MSKLCKTNRPNRQRNRVCNPGLGSGVRGKTDIENIIEITKEI